jgi:hypothetical protein
MPAPIRGHGPPERRSRPAEGGFETVRCGGATTSRGWQLMIDAKYKTKPPESQAPNRARRSSEEINRTWPLFDWWDHAPRGHFGILHIGRDTDPLAVKQQIARPRWVCIAQDAPAELVAKVMERATVLMAGRPLPRSAYDVAGARAFHNQRVLLVEQQRLCATPFRAKLLICTECAVQHAVGLAYVRADRPEVPPWALFYSDAAGHA